MRPLCEEHKLICVSMFQAAHPQTEGVAVSAAILSPPLGGSVIVCQATSSTKMASAALLMVSHTMAKHSAEVDKLTQINTPQAFLLLIFHKHFL